MSQDKSDSLRQCFAIFPAIDFIVHIYHLLQG